MAAVRGGPGRGRGGTRLAEGEAPEAHVAEQGKKVIKDLVARQTATAATLELQRAREREREFRRAAAVLPLGNASAGTSTLQDFAASAERARRTEELVSKGLPLHDLHLLLEHEEGLETTVRLTEPERLAREERLLAIQERLSSSTAPAQAPAQAPADQAEQGRAGPSRHVQELASSLRLDSQVSPFVRLALDRPPDGGEASDDVEDVPHFREAAPHAPQHPVHRLVDLERGMFGHLDAAAAGGVAPPSATSRKRRRQRELVEKLKVRDAPSERGVGDGGVGGASGRGRGGGSGDTAASLWDVRDAGPAPQAQRGFQVKAAIVKEGRPYGEPYGPARPKQYTIADGKIVELDSRTASRTASRLVSGVDADSWTSSCSTDSSPSENKQRHRGELFVPTGQGVIPAGELGRDRLSIDEIRKLPRFSNYEEGNPSSVLYVKNLDHSVTEDDLAAVFGSFQRAGSTSISFRLCGGRMRGQAFVTFPTQEDATAALAAVNGYLLKGRPVIVQYGRGQS